jgi:hypothetical protein
MDQLKASENHGAAVTQKVSSVYVPPLQLTKGQPPLKSGHIYKAASRSSVACGVNNGHRGTS